MSDVEMVIFNVPAGNLISMYLVHIITRIRGSTIVAQSTFGVKNNYKERDKHDKKT